MHTKTVLLKGGPWHGQVREVREDATGFNLAECPPVAVTPCHEPVTPALCTYKVWHYSRTGDFTRSGLEVFACG